MVLGPLEGETTVTEAPDMPPVVVNAKSLVSTPVTSSLKVTVKSTELALVGLASARTLARHQTPHAQLVAAVSPETRAAYLALTGPVR